MEMHLFPLTLCFFVDEENFIDLVIAHPWSICRIHGCTQTPQSPGPKPQLPQFLLFHHNPTTMATLKPPSATPRSSSSSTPTGPPKAPLKADPTAIIADTVVFQGTHPVTIGAGTVIHPRARFYAYEGPIVVGDGCIISEKVVIGAGPSAPSTASRGGSPATCTANSPTPDTHSERTETKTRLSYFVTIGPQSTILPGAHIHSSASVEALVTVNRHVEIGSHAKVCSGCEIQANTSVGEWMVVWGSGLGQRRKRTRGAKTPGPSIVATGLGQAPEGKVIEDARLMVLQKEREVLSRMLVPAGPGRKK